MNDNYNNSGKKNQSSFRKYLDLLNSIILSLKNKPLVDLQELSNESTVYSLILEIEPNFEKNPINNKIELTIDSSPEIRYNNFNLIFSAVINYKNESKSKDKFSKETNFVKYISINDLLNNDIEQLIKVAEMLCFLTIITSNKNYFIEKINEIEDNRLSNFYYSIIEKYITFKIDESISNIVEKTNVSNIFSNNSQMTNVKRYNLKGEQDRKSIDLKNDEINIKDFPILNEDQKVKIINPTKTILITGQDSIYTENDENKIIKNDNFQEKEKKMMQIEIDNLNNELMRIKEKYQNSENDKRILEQNLNHLKEQNNSNHNTSFNKNEISNDNININIYPNSLQTKKVDIYENNLIKKNKDLEDANKIIENLRNENEQLRKSIEKISLEKQKLEIQVEKSDLNLQKLKLENDKIKEEQKIQEKNYNEIISKDKNIIEKLKKDVNNQMKINEKINEEKKMLQKEVEKYKLEAKMNLMNQNGGINIVNNINENNNNENELKSEIQKLKNNLSQKEKQIKELEDINLEYEKDKGEDINFYKKSYEEQKIRVNEEHKLISESLYKLAIHFMTLKDDLQKRINSTNSDK